jgi:hypothetical protein
MAFKEIKSYIYKSFKRVRFKIEYRLYLNKSSRNFSQNILEKSNDSKIDLITIAFNNVQVIDYQIQLIKKYVKDDYAHIIADNSNNPEIRKDIYNICKKYGVLYVELPSIKLKPSWSHAAALHWSFKNIIQKRDSQYFGFLDHDIFPIKESTIIDKIKNGIYGRIIPAYGANEISMAQPYWSLWGGFFFFDASLFKNVGAYEIDFFPKVISQELILDTVGGLWDKILSKIVLPKEPLLSYRQVPINEFGEIKNLQSDAYEQLDYWLHIVNLSNWYGVNNIDNKMNIILQKIENHI